MHIKCEVWIRAVSAVHMKHELCVRAVCRCDIHSLGIGYPVFLTHFSQSCDMFQGLGCAFRVSFILLMHVSGLLLSHWPCYPILFLFTRLHMPNSITILTFPFSKPSHKITWQEDEHKHNDNDHNHELVTLVPTILITPIRILYERPSPWTNQSHIART